MPTPKRLRQNLGLIIGIFMGGLALVVLLSPDQESLHARGPMNSGHEDLECEYCHQPARGTLRQQIQANARYLTGQRNSPADFGLSAAGNDQCLACHERPNDRHPVFRFNEPRFQEARSAIHPESCISCHREHRGERTTIASLDYCQHCHEDTLLKNDPVDISHEELIADERWNTCLGCHDFHGNHLMEVPDKLSEAIPPGELQIYLRGGESPYGNDKYHEPSKKPQNKKPINKEPQ
jgi:hypothetical protein